jgi:N-acyl-D-aspartate/D-glutamate deacylase
MDLLIRGGTVIDGTGKPPVAADVSVEAGRIGEIGRIPSPDGVPVLDAAGCVVSPGFIDIHSHSDFTLLLDPRAVSSIAQGVTFEVVGNCGHGCAPALDPELVCSNIYGFEPSFGLRWQSMGEYLDCLQSARPAVNVASLVPNGNLRLATAGVVDRPSTPSETEEMRRLLEQSLEQGAIGYSTGLEYGIERGCSEEEVQSLCRLTQASGGFYATHTRNLDGQPRESIAEAVRASERTGVPLQISHISSVARLIEDGGAAVREAIGQVEAGARRGLDVAFDMHTRPFGTTNLSAVLPPWALAGGKQAIAERLRTPSVRREMRQAPNIVAALARGDWSRIVVFESKASPKASRRSIAELSREFDQDPFDTIYDLLASEIDHLHELMVIAHAYRPEDIEPAYLHPLCMIGSDATALAPDGPLANKFFHGAYTWIGWFWRNFVRERRLIEPEEAVRRVTGLPAGRLGLRDRGVLRPGACADVTVFDPAALAERGTLFEPNQTACGVRHVLVNGVPALRDSMPTGLRAGQVVRSSPRRAR